MKRLIYVGLLAFALPCHGQLVLKSGDTWTWQFDSLTRTGSVPAFGVNPNGSFTLMVNSSTFQSGDLLGYEMFENSTSEMPICSGVLTAAPPFSLSCERDFSWQDLQGAIRLTMISGSVTVDNITVNVVKAGPSLSSYDVYSATFLPVSLNAALSGGKLVLAWPRGTNEFLLQTAPNLSPPVTWKTATNSIYLSSTNFYTTNDLAGPSQFFRLQFRTR